MRPAAGAPGSLETRWIVWQLLDSAFPTGGFAHSAGLEAAWQQGEVTDAASLRAFLEAALWQTGYGTLPFVTAAHRDPDRFAALDELNDVFLINPVANRASRVQGRALAASAARVWPGPALEAFEAAARDACAHVGPVTGVVFRRLGVPLASVQPMVLYAAARAVCAAAVRLGLAGSYEAQRLQTAGRVAAAGVLARCGDLDVACAAQAAPLIDLVQAGHDRLYSRLFQS
jgi:urease accessory protein